jgi:hypothetical protein
MKYIVILFLAIFSLNAAVAQFGACDCSVSIPNNSGIIQFSNITWTGTGCPTAGSTSYTGNLCADLGSNSLIRIDKNFTINGDFKITTSGTNAVLRVPSSYTLTINGDLGDATNNDAQFEIDGTLIVTGGIYGKNNNQFDSGGSGTGSITAGSIVMGNNTSCVAPSNCTGINWNIGSCSPSGSTFCQTVIALPVTLLYFDAKVLGSAVELSWATATEVNSSHFVVERSLDGKAFHEISQVNAAGQSVTKKVYSVTDDRPLIGRVYYRLKEVDLDGTTEHFNMKLVDLKGKRGVSIYPNPSIDSEVITISLNFSNDEKAYIKIADVSGHEVKKLTFTGTEMTLPFKPAKGSYIVTVTTGKETYFARLVVP